MPCNDITEVLRLDLDPEDVVRSYSLHKRTCGAPIGQSSLLLALVAGMPIARVLALEPSVALSHFAPLAREEFLYAKHLAALKHGLLVLTGAKSPEDVGCTPTQVAADAEGVHFEGLVAIDAVTQRIKACGNCKSCGAH